jgi:hypothetical protein
LAAAFTWHLLVQLPFDSNATPPAWWQAPQETFLASAGLCTPALKFRSPLESGHSLGWQVLQSSFTRLACAAWSKVTFPVLATKTILGGASFFVWARTPNPLVTNTMNIKVRKERMASG